jgi:branched-chain amino acid transport system substrate-binding protein
LLIELTRPGLWLYNRQSDAREASDMADIGKSGTATDHAASKTATRRRVLAASGVALGTALSPIPLRFALAQSKPYRIGTMQPLSGAAAIIGKTALVGVQMAVDRINKAGGINGRPVELIVAD